MNLMDPPILASSARCSTALRPSLALPPMTSNPLLHTRSHCLLRLHPVHTHPYERTGRLAYSHDAPDSPLHRRRDIHQFRQRIIVGARRGLISYRLTLSRRPFIFDRPRTNTARDSARRPRWHHLRRGTACRRLGPIRQKAEARPGRPMSDSINDEMPPWRNIDPTTPVSLRLLVARRMAAYDNRPRPCIRTRTVQPRCVTRRTILDQAREGDHRRQNPARVRRQAAYRASRPVTQIRTSAHLVAHPSTALFDRQKRVSR